MSEWTKEPWRFDGKNNLTTFNGDQLLLVGVSLDMSRDTTEAKANSTRIVACVNACAGIPTAQLPGLAGEVRRLREALTKTTAACEAFAKWFDAWCPSNRCCASSGLPIHEKALKAIDKAQAVLAGGEK